MNATDSIHIIDTGFLRPSFDAAYLVIENDHAAFIDCGTNHSVANLLAALQAHGLAPDAVDWLILTHVHLDHAGGAGELMSRLPKAKLVVHPRGVRHMVDPSRLWAGACAVYGEAEMERSYGKLRPVPAERVVAAPDGFEVDLAGRTLRCLATPGHAKHHNAILDTASGCVFSGDTFGLSYREFDTARGAFILPTTSPIDFDPDALHASIARIVALAPPAVYVTHFGPVHEIARLAEDLHATIDAMVEIAEAHEHDDLRHPKLVDALGKLYVKRTRAHDVALSTEQILAVLAGDIELNAQGLEVWLQGRQREVAA